jgi:integrase
MSLSDAAVRALRPRDRPFKVGDAAGLYVLVSPTGSRLWRLNYMRAGRQKTLALGSYPAVSLAEARSARDAAKAQLRGGIDPVEVIKVEKAAAAAAVTTFADVATEWFKVKVMDEKRAPNTIRRTEWLLDVLNAGIGGRPIATIEAPDLLEVLRRVEANGNHEATKRLRATASAIFRFGIATGKCKRDPASDLRGALTNRQAQPRSAIVEPVAVGKLLRDIDRRARPVMLKQALQLLMLTFVRPYELMSAEWSEISTDGVWVVPASRMKMRKEFHVPLSKQALAILAELRKVTGAGRFVFPSRKRGRPIHADKLTEALRTLGYNGDEVSAHGFRSTASTLLNEETKFSADAIELCLAHKLPGVRAIYNRSLRWPERVEIMNWYADRLDELRGRGTVVKLAKRSKVDT